MPTLNNPFPADSRLYDIAETLLSRPAPPLVPEAPWNQETAKAIEQATAAENASLFVTAALHLLNDDLDRAHRLVQAQEGDQTADYLHMLVHRREGDWSNTGYWVRRAGEHPVYAALVSAIQTEPGSPAPVSDRGRWDPQAMVDICRQAAQGKSDMETAMSVSELSAREIAAALDWCVRNTGAGAMSAR